MRPLILFLAFSMLAFAASPHKSAQSPKTVAQKSFPGQVGPIATTTLFTPIVDGNFRISVYAEFQAALPITAPTTLQCVNVRWTDSFHPQTVVHSDFTTFDACAGGRPDKTDFEYSLVVHAKGGTPITADATVFCTPGISCLVDNTVVYNAYIEVEQF